MEEDQFSRKALAALNDTKTEICTQVERSFLRTLEGGCTAPIGALATIEGDRLYFKGALFSLDGKECLEVEKEIPVSESVHFGATCAREILDNGGKEIMRGIALALKK